MGYCVRCATLRKPEEGYHDWASYESGKSPHNQDHFDRDHPTSQVIEWVNVEDLTPADLAFLPGRGDIPGWERVVYVWPDPRDPERVKVMDRTHRTNSFPRGKRVQRYAALPVVPQTDENGPSLEER